LRSQPNTKWQEDEVEEDSRQLGLGGKLPAKRDEKKGEMVSPQSANGNSPAAGDERRPKHVGDDVGETVLPSGFWELGFKIHIFPGVLRVTNPRTIRGRARNENFSARISRSWADSSL